MNPTNILSKIVRASFPALLLFFTAAAPYSFPASSISSLQELGSSAGRSYLTAEVSDTQGDGSLFVWVNGSLPCDANAGGGDGGTTFCSFVSALDTSHYRTDGYWKRVFSGDVNINWFGADPTGSVDSSAAIQAACAAAPGFSAATSVLVPNGNYNSSSAGSTCVSIHGLSARRSRIFSSDTTHPILTFSGGIGRSVYGLQLDYTSSAAGATNAACVRFTSWRRGSVNDLYLQDCYTGIDLSQRGTSGVFNISFSNINIQHPLGRAIDASVVSGITIGDLFFKNIYINCRDSGGSATAPGNFLTEWATGNNFVFTGLNEEGCSGGKWNYFHSDVINVSLLAVHIEENTPTTTAANQGWFVFAGSVSPHFGKMTFYNNTLSSANITSGLWPIIEYQSASSGGIATVENIFWNSNTISSVTSPISNYVESGGAASGWTMLLNKVSGDLTGLTVAGYGSGAVSTYKNYLAQNGPFLLTPQVYKAPSGNFTAYCGKSQNFVTPAAILTVSATVTLDTTTAYQGCQIEIFIPTGMAGAYHWNVPGGVTALVGGYGASYVYDGAAWLVTNGSITVP